MSYNLPTILFITSDYYLYKDALYKLPHELAKGLSLRIIGN